MYLFIKYFTWETLAFSGIRQDAKHEHGLSLGLHLCNWKLGSDIRSWLINILTHVQDILASSHWQHVETSYFLSLHYMMKTIPVEPAILLPLTKEKWMLMNRNVKFQSPVLMVSLLSPVIVKCMWRSVSSKCTWCLHPPPLQLASWCSHSLYCWCRIATRALSSYYCIQFWN